MAGLGRIYFIGPSGGFMGADGVTPLLAQIGPVERP